MLDIVVLAVVVLVVVPILAVSVCWIGARNLARLSCALLTSLEYQMNADISPITATLIKIVENSIFLRSGIVSI